MILYPNAKLNVGLKILNKRKDNYHNISSVFIPIGLTDIIEFSKAKDGKFNFIQTGIEIEGLREDNLCVKVYDYFKTKFDIPSLMLHLHKQIPTQAGLGGGSSDAAFFAKGLNDYFNLKLSNNQLEEIVLRFGSDCPFFVNNTISIVQGRGEIITPIDMDFFEYHFIIIKPDFSISTAEAYSNILPANENTNWENILNNDVDSWENLIKNDFEKFVFNKYPEIENIKMILYNNGALYAQMSGSGSAIYGIFRERKNQINKLFKGSFVYWTTIN